MKIVVRYDNRVEVVNLSSVPRQEDNVVIDNEIWLVTNVKWDLGTEEPFATIYLERVFSASTR